MIKNYLFRGAGATNKEHRLALTARDVRQAGRGGTMAITQDTVKYVAHLARIDLPPKELEKLSQQLQEILGFIDKLKKVDIKDIVPTSHILPINNVLRDDLPAESLSSDKALENAPERQGNFFGVPKVIE